MVLDARDDYRGVMEMGFGTGLCGMETVKAGKMALLML